MFLPIGAVFKRLEDNANDFHESIFAALAKGDADAAETAMRNHLLAGRKSIENLLTDVA